MTELSGMPSAPMEIIGQETLLDKWVEVLKKDYYLFEKEGEEDEVEDMPGRLHELMEKALATGHVDTMPEMARTLEEHKTQWRCINHNYEASITEMVLLLWEDKVLLRHLCMRLLNTHVARQLAKRELLKTELPAGVVALLGDYFRWDWMVPDNDDDDDDYDDE